MVADRRFGKGVAPVLGARLLGVIESGGQPRDGPRHALGADMGKGGMRIFTVRVMRTM